jgi:hypothetical protein
MKTADRIIAIDPDVVISWGGVYEPLLFRRLLYNNFPHIQIQFSIANEEHEFADFFLSEGYPSGFAAKRFPERWRHHREPFEFPPREHAYPREHVKQHPEEFTIVTAITGGRIENAVRRFREEIISSLIKLMEVHPHVAWVCLGVVEPEAILNLDPSLAALAEQGRLRLLPFEWQLQSFYEHCNAYLHLPGVAGGATGVAMAATEGLPVLLVKGCDSENSSPAESVHPNFTAAVATLAGFIEEPESAVAFGRKCQERIREHTRAACGQELSQVLEEARHRARHRLPRSGPSAIAENPRSIVQPPPAGNGSREMPEDQDELVRQREWILDRIEAVYGRRDGFSETISESGFAYVDAVARQIAADKPSIDFLEIGSFMGISLVAWATSFRRFSVLGDVVSVDPYSPLPYSQTPPWKEGESIDFLAGPQTLAMAMRLYARCELNVRIIRATTRDALSELLAGTRRFDVVFVDGNHEGLNPLFDFAAATALVRPGSYIILDDTQWPDVAPIKELCDKHLVRVAQSFAKACYKTG